MASPVFAAGRPRAPDRLLSLNDAWSFRCALCHALWQFFGARFAIPFLKGVRRNLALDQKLGELASLCLALERHRAVLASLGAAASMQFMLRREQSRMSEIAVCRHGRLCRRAENGLKTTSAAIAGTGKRDAIICAGAWAMRIKIHGGTPTNDGGSLCNTCRYSRITRGRTLDEELVMCDASHMRTTRITFKVTSCSHYTDHSVPGYFELLQQAWILQPASRKRPAGFVRASDLRDEEFSKYMADLREHDGP
jgi:hypothetical protein